jgi:hypothetical protein
MWMLAGTGLMVMMDEAHRYPAFELLIPNAICWAGGR